MNIWDTYVAVLHKYTVFSGRASRREFWSFVLVNCVVGVVLGWLSPVISSLYALVVLLPNLGVGIRRLHDIDRSGWWLLIALVPVIGAIILLVFAVLKGTSGSNRFGPVSA